MLKNASTSLIVRGVLALIVGVIAIAWPNVTILALVILFAVYAFMDAGLEFAPPSAAGGPDRSSVTCCSACSAWRPAWSPWSGRRLPRWC